KDGKLWGKPTEKEWDKDAPYWNLKGNGGILSTTEDLYKWNQAFLTDDILSKDAKQKYFHPKLRDNEDTNSYYAYGWDVHKTDRNSSLIQHNGFNGIFYADFFRFVDENVVVISLSNQASRNFMNINHQLAEIIFDPSYKPTIPIADNEANRNFTQKIINIILAKGLETAKKTYMNRNTETNLLECEINTKGYDLLSGNKIDQAIAIFEMNVYAFPQSANAFDSLAEAYMGKGDNELATKYYKKSLSLNPENANAEEMLKKLEK
ncbi:MAG: serine hydrolase, partial [candidate division KSB1 bacterium]